MALTLARLKRDRTDIPRYASNMTLIYLLRHCESSANKEGILAGRIEKIGLSKLGSKQAEKLAAILTQESFSRIYLSPLQRCAETIEPYLKKSRKKAVKEPLFLEMNYGKWSGRKLSELRREKDWKYIQLKPSRFKFPSGESFLAAERRIKRGLNKVARANPKGKVLVVSHGDPIKIAVQLALKGDLDFFQRVVIDPGSVTIIDWPSGTLIGANIPAKSLGGRKKKQEKGISKAMLHNRRVLGGGTNVSSRI
jgi:probable phosphoglycerate mutase